MTSIVQQWAAERALVEAAIPATAPGWLREAIVEVARRRGAQARHDARVQCVMAAARRGARVILGVGDHILDEELPWSIGLAAVLLIEAEVGGLRRTGSPPPQAPDWFVGFAATRRAEWWVGGSGRPHASDGDAWRAAAIAARTIIGGAPVIAGCTEDGALLIEDRHDDTGQAAIMIPSAWPVVREQLAYLAAMEWVRDGGAA